MADNIKAEFGKILEIALTEDIGKGDATAEAIIPAKATAKYEFRTRDDIIFCGAEAITQAFTLKTELHAKDGDYLKAGTLIATVEGNVRQILTRERTVLNLLQHLSGIATYTNLFVRKTRGTNAKILDTRKTTPGLRILEKYAVKCGGGQNHRMGLYDMVMIKDNHIKAAGGIAEAVSKARKTKLKIEVECDSIEQVHEALAAKVDIIMADNMNLKRLKQVVAIVNGQIPIEASGNVTLDTVAAIAATGVDFISSSKITLSAKAVDIGLDEIL